MKTTESKDAVIMNPDAPASASVIWLHGLGADGHDFVSIVPELELPAALPVRFVFPHAPVRPITLNGGMAMRGWYDIISLDRQGLQDDAGVRASEKTIRGIIERERAVGVPAKRIIIAGFSQGGAIALHTALRYPERLGGLLALSTYLPLHDTLAAEASSANRDLAILMCHGRFDPVLPMSLGTSSRDQLRKLGYTVEWQDYPMQHQVCLEEIEHIGRWLRGLLG